MKIFKLNNTTNVATNSLLIIVQFAVWFTAIVCLTVVFKIGFDKKNLLKIFAGSDNLLNSKNIVDSVLLNSGDLNFSDKTSFVVDAFRFQGNFEKLPEKLNIDKDRQKLYNYIFQRKSKQINKVIKPAKSEDFSIKSISNP